MAQKSEVKKSDDPVAANPPEALAKVRLLMLISAVTTAIAIAAVVGVIGYRVYHTGDSGAGSITNKVIALANTTNSWTPCRAATTSKVRTACAQAFSVAPCR